MNSFLYLVIIAFFIFGLIEITYYTFLKKTSNRKGKTKIKWEVILDKFLQIKFESEYEDDTKK